MRTYYFAWPLFKAVLFKKNRTPSLHLNSIAELTPSELEKLGVKGIIFDVDNTLTAHHQPTIHNKVKSSFDNLCTQFTCGIFSNCGEARNNELHIIFKDYNLPIAAASFKKPKPYGYLWLCEQMQLKPQEILMVGDRILTDIAGANHLGMHTLLVEPLEPNEFQTITKIRSFERKFLRETKPRIKK